MEGERRGHCAFRGEERREVEGQWWVSPTEPSDVIKTDLVQRTKDPPFPESRPLRMSEAGEKKLHGFFFFFPQKSPRRQALRLKSNFSRSCSHKVPTVTSLEWLLFLLKFHL